MTFPLFAEPAEPLPVIRLDGQEFVEAAALPKAAQIAVKELPGRGEWVACYRDRCALLEKSVLRDGKRWIAVTELAEVLGLRIDWNAERSQVSLTAAPDSARIANPDGSQTFTVGDLAPDIRLPKLDGGWITLSELRGKRVLINSWASW